jgi:hypothetical protein
MRAMTTDVIAQLQAGTVYPALFCSAQFLDGTIYVWSGYGTFSWNGQTWIGLGKFGGISAIPEGTGTDTTGLPGTVSHGITLTLSGVPNDLLSEALNQCQQGLPVSLWLGFLTPQGAIIADPVLLWAGRSDVPTIKEGPETSTIELTVENSLIDLERARERHYTDADQQLFYPGDTGFQYVPAVQAWNGAWGKAPGS